MAVVLPIGTNGHPFLNKPGVRSKVEPVFGVMKQHFGLASVCHKNRRRARSIPVK